MTFWSFPVAFCIDFEQNISKSQHLSSFNFKICSLTFQAPHSASGWCMRFFECGKRVIAYPLCHLVAMTDPIEAACPMIYVEISHGMKFMVSTIPSPAVTDPPGELTYNADVSFRNHRLPGIEQVEQQSRFADSSMTGPPIKMIRSLRSREKRYRRIVLLFQFSR